MVRLRDEASTVEKTVSSENQPKIKWLGFFLGLWLVSIFVFPLASRVFFNGGFLQISYVAAIIWPEVLFLFILKNLTPKRLTTNELIAVTFFFIAVLLSSIVSIDKINTALFFVLTIFVFIIILQFKKNLTSVQYIVGLRTYSFTALIIALMFALYDYRPGVRLGNGTDILNPNAISIILMSIAISAMAFKAKLVRVCVAALAVYLLYLTGSRTSLVSMVIGVAVFVYYTSLTSTKINKYLFYLIVVIASVSTVIFFDQIWQSVSLVLKIDDAHRGLSTGASGRMGIWLEAWLLFLDNMITGIGYRTHEIVLGISAHNGYLATLLEIGLIGFLAIMYIVVRGVLSLRNNIKLKNEINYNAIMIAFCLGYMFLAMFERYLINIGNPASLIFLLAILSPRSTKHENI